jgi:hypothetical protein
MIRIHPHRFATSPFLLALVFAHVMPTLAQADTPITILHDFTSGLSGDFNPNSLTVANGMLYGTTAAGQYDGYDSTVFNMNLDGSNFNVLQTFTSLYEGTAGCHRVDGRRGKAQRLMVPGTSSAWRITLAATTTPATDSH